MCRERFGYQQPLINESPHEQMNECMHHERELLSHSWPQRARLFCLNRFLRSGWCVGLGAVLAVLCEWESVCWGGGGNWRILIGGMGWDGMG